MIAYHFPPVQGSSGVQRSLRFAQHLPRFGWKPIVLSIDPRAYEASAPVKGNEVPADLEVHRAYGLDIAKTLGVFNRYPRPLALPDRWALWRFWAVPAALRLIRTRRISAVWTTFPIATAHRIGLEVSQRSGVPWIAEFRDPMWYPDYPEDPIGNRAWLKLEQEIFGHATRVIVTAPSAIDLYAARYPTFHREHLSLIENGYDEDAFLRAEASAGGAGPSVAADRPLKLVHSGIIYTNERDPTDFFVAIAAMKAKRLISAQNLQIILRASGNEASYAHELRRLRVADVVRLAPPVDYVTALHEMLSSDGLLIFQASNANSQIPAKLYEYLRARRPILALTDPGGDTARTLQQSRAGVSARLDHAPDIEAALVSFLDGIRRGEWSHLATADTSCYSRETRARQLSDLLGEVAGAGSDSHRVHSPRLDSVQLARA
jgi:hypothetical protein